MGKHLKILVLILFLSSYASGQSEYTLTLNTESFLKINGSTNIARFCLTLPGKSFPGSVYTFRSTIEDNTITITENELLLSVKNFQSNDLLALNGFRKLVKADKYPYLKIGLVNINLSSLSQGLSGGKNKEARKGNARIAITITGVSNQYVMPFSATLTSNVLSASGQLKVNMKDFGLIPPEEMFGLVKTSEWLEIDLNIKALLQGGILQDLN